MSGAGVGEAVREAAAKVCDKAGEAYRKDFDATLNEAYRNRWLVAEKLARDVRALALPSDVGRAGAEVVRLRERLERRITEAFAEFEDIYLRGVDANAWLLKQRVSRLGDEVIRRVLEDRPRPPAVRRAYLCGNGGAATRLRAHIGRPCAASVRRACGVAGWGRSSSEVA